MKVFGRELKKALESVETGRDRRWIYVPYDQLSDSIGPLSEPTPRDLGIVLIESPAKAARRPYHKAKLFLILANQRRFALEQAERGVEVRYLVSEDGEGYAEPLRRAAKELGTLVHMEPAERELRHELEPLVKEGLLEAVPHEAWLTTPEDFTKGTGAEPPWRMDRFYRAVRRRTGILMDGKDFEGGQLSFDGDNRESWPGDPPAPEVPRFRPGDIEDEVAALIESRYSRHPGQLDPASLPTRKSQVDRLWQWALEECMEYFGPFEDAMAREEASLFHTRISPLLHLCRLLPRDVVKDVAELDAPIASREGFVRQVLGWREFVRHVHRATDGFRDLPDGTPRESKPKGDAGWKHWTGEAWENGADAGAAPSALGSARDLPPAYWGERSGLDCLDLSVARVLESGYGHHIERLMVLANLGTLLDLSPRQLTDWFWAAYVDAYDWVVEPNVLGMGTYGAGSVMTTKPYVSGSAYIDRMSDFCGACAFHPKKTCPITHLYWAFLARHAGELEGNQRIAMPLRSLQKRSEEKRAADARVFEHVTEVLGRGDSLTPEGVQDALDS
ncbi:Deoxyribodipyrimidine photo-lyase-related protein [Planctomycetes bacterium Poly30]|uniref:Deoxyribodipyrimidine photo-lyase-related protein n=1 Tax=Saltatorellus ferox TaxID=2528018 RepID=A0A518EM62_9BACT|nr:Deoxyribodipyrimidine photo-lyase-related protein [Planctomycetes bacterium Poly30]